MAKSAGISGLAVAMAAVGTYLVYSGVKNIPLLDGARDLLRGRVPQGTPGKVSTIGVTPDGGTAGGAAGVLPGSYGSTPAPAGSLNAAIVAEAQKHLGAPYRWGAVGPSTFDCSGLVVYVLRRLGLTLARHTTTTFLIWPGAVTVPRSQVVPGDLAIWQGHMGIFVSPTEMIHAPRTGDVVKVGPVDGVPTRGKLTCRRVLDRRPGKTVTA